MRCAMGNIKKLSVWRTTTTLKLSAAVNQGPSSPSVKLKQVSGPGLSGVSYQEKDENIDSVGGRGIQLLIAAEILLGE